MNSINNEGFEKTLFEYFLGLLGQIKIYHWTTMNYATHKALDDLHSNLSSDIDNIVEIYIGKYEIQPIKKFNIHMKANTDASNVLDFLKGEREKIKLLRDKQFKKCSPIQNIIDNMMGSINKTIYLCNLN